MVVERNVCTIVKPNQEHFDKKSELFGPPIGIQRTSLGSHSLQSHR